MTGYDSAASRWKSLAAAGIVGAMLLAGVSGMGGCALGRGMEIAVAEPEGGWPTRSAIDVQNFHGSVTVIVDPTLDRIVPTATARARQSVGNGVQWKPAEAVSVVMNVQQQDGGQVLVVRSGANWPDPDDVWVDLTIRMPACSGAMIWNRGGPVELVGVEGALHVENGPLEAIEGRGEGRSDGSIVVRTAAPMTGPVALVTTRGSVVYQVGKNSTGAFELVSGSEPVQFYCRELRPDEVRVEGNSMQATLNGGTNPVMLRSDKGLVRVMVIDEPVAYKNLLR